MVQEIEESQERCPWGGEKQWAPVPSTGHPGAQRSMRVTAEMVGADWTGGG